MSDVRHFGATGDGTTDDTEALRHALQDGDGSLHLPPGTYRITSTLEVNLDQTGRFALEGSGGTARLVMAGPGPVLRLRGSHRGTGDPSSVSAAVADRQRMPTVRQLEIVGEHPDSSGIELVETLQAVLDGLLVRQTQHAIRLHGRNRNVIISNCHLYYNRGVGVLLDEVNLHQINITGNHISYNGEGGIRVQGSEIRNLQITGNDIEYNNHRVHERPPTPTAEIYIDTTADGSSVAEVTINSNTIQATPSPGGSNLRILQNEQGTAPGLWTITGNIIGSQENNVHLTGCHGVTLAGNVIYSCTNRNLLIERSRQITVGSCIFRRHTPAMHAGVRVEHSHDLNLHGCTLEDESAEGQASGASLLELQSCQRVNVTGCQILGGVPYGVDARDCRLVTILGCTIVDPRPMRRSRASVRFQGSGEQNRLAHNVWDGPEALELAETAGVEVS